MIIMCAFCGEEADKPTGGVNRARAKGAPVYCGMQCAGLARRKHKTDAQKREEKRLYDMEYRRKNLASIKAKKAAHFQRTYDPEKARIERKKRMPYHVEYCRRPEYRAYKRDYDRRYRAVKHYGDYADCFMLVQDIRTECLSQKSDYEIRLENGTLNKQLQRRRDYEKLNRKEPEIGPLGNLERRERR